MGHIEVIWRRVVLCSQLLPGIQKERRSLTITLFQKHKSQGSVKSNVIRVSAASVGTAQEDAIQVRDSGKACQ